MASQTAILEGPATPAPTSVASTGPGHHNGDCAPARLASFPVAIDSCPSSAASSRQGEVGTPKPRLHAAAVPVGEGKATPAGTAPATTATAGVQASPDLEVPAAIPSPSPQVRPTVGVLVTPVLYSGVSSTPEMKCFLFVMNE